MVSNQTSESQSLVERLRLGEGTSPDHFLLLEAADEIERLMRENAEMTLQVESLQNKWATRPLDHPSGDALMAENDRLRAALERIAVDEHSYAGCVGCQDAAKIAHEALAPKPMMSADGGEDIPL